MSRINYVLYNPLAGHGDPMAYTWLAELQASESVILQDITALSDRAAYETFLSRPTEDDRLILCGGDGTLNRFACAVGGIDIRSDILYYPGGTGNDFLHDLGKTPEDAPFSVKAYLQGLPTVEVNGSRSLFINNVGFGIDGYCCEVGDALRAERADDPHAKPVNYAAIAIKGLLFHFKPRNATVTVDGVTYSYRKVWIAPTMKGRYYGGGMMPTPAQDRLNPDGTLSLMLMHGTG